MYLYLQAVTAAALCTLETQSLLACASYLTILDIEKKKDSSHPLSIIIFKIFKNANKKKLCMYALINYTIQL